jgi:hypothetical protein
MELTTKLFSCSDTSYNGCIIPKDVMRDAVNKLIDKQTKCPTIVQLVAPPDVGEAATLHNAVGAVKNISLDENGDVNATLLTIPTPEGEALVTMMGDPEYFHPTITPVGYGAVDDDGNITHLDITHFALSFETPPK